MASLRQEHDGRRADFKTNQTLEHPEASRPARLRGARGVLGGGLGKGGTLLVNGKKVTESKIEHTQAMVFSADETADVGEDDATPVTEDYKERDNKFTSTIRKVTIDLGPAKVGALDQNELRAAELRIKAGE